MAEEHANVSLLKRLDLSNIAAAADLFAQDVVWLFFNPLLPDVQGDYVGMTGIRTFFEKIGVLTDDTFQVEPISITAVGDELVVTHTKNRMTLRGRPIATDVVAVWRIVEGRIAEVWDIPPFMRRPCGHKADAELIRVNCTLLRMPACVHDSEGSIDPGSRQKT